MQSNIINQGETDTIAHKLYYFNKIFDGVLPNRCILQKERDDADAGVSHYLDKDRIHFIWWRQLSAEYAI